MATPRDFHKQDQTGWVKAARLFSDIVSPPVLFAVLGLAFGLKEMPNWLGFAWAAFYGLMISLGPILLVLYLLRMGYIKELHMSHTHERHIPYATAVVLAMVAALVLAWADGPSLLRDLAWLNALNLAALGLINTRYLISIHANAVMATFWLAGLVFSWWVALLAVLPLLVGVVVVRLYLKRHTADQIATGLLLGSFTVWLTTAVFHFFA